MPSFVPEREATVRIGAAPYCSQIVFATFPGCGTSRQKQHRNAENKPGSLLRKAQSYNIDRF